MAWVDLVFLSAWPAVGCGWACWPGSGRAGPAGGVLVSGESWRGARAWLWRCGEAGEGGFPAAFACSGREAGGGAALVFGLAGVPGGEDPLVADRVQGGEPERGRGQAHEAAPAAGDGVAGGVLDGGEASFGGGAAGVGAAVRRGGVVVFLPGLRRDIRPDGEGLLGAAGRRVLGGVRISGRLRSRVIEAGPSGQRSLPAAAGQVTRW